MKSTQSFGNKLYPKYTNDPEKFDKVISDFIEYIRKMDDIKGDFELDFRNERSILYKQEDYKRRIQIDMKKALMWNEWEEASIGSGSISKKFYDEITLRENITEFNLVDKGQGRGKENSTLAKFKRKLKDKDSKYNVEQALFDIYRSKGHEAEGNAFREAVVQFGGNYDLISFLFFLKNPKRFLPLKPKRIEKSFEMLGIEHRMQLQCGKPDGWENYKKYLDIVKKLRKQVLSYFNPEITLLDTHSFLWIIWQDGPDRFRRWRESLPESPTGDLWIEEDAFNLSIMTERPDTFGIPKRTYKGKKSDERNKKKLGDAGEKFIFEREKEKMIRNGINETPEWIARDKGDGYGYDIVSYEKNGDEIHKVYIEVKTTVYGIYRPLYITANELEKSIKYGDAYRLYRVYNFGAAIDKVKIWVEKGSLEKFCQIPETYKVYLEPQREDVI